MDTLGVSERLVGRCDELGRLATVVDAAAAGRGAILVVAGAAGVGKTSLLGACGEMAVERGMQVLRARGADLERDLEFSLLRQLFAPLLAGDGTMRDPEVTAGAARLALPALEATTGSESSAPERGAVFHGLYWLCANLAARDPLVLLVDDAHWADRRSLEWIGYLARRLEGVAAAVVLATRTGEPSDGRLASLLGSLSDEGSAAVLGVAELGPADTAALVRRRMGGDSSEGFFRACHQATGGNPFYLDQLLTELTASRVPPTDDSSAQVTQVVPAAVQRSVVARITRHGDPAARIARAAAVLGRDVSVRRAAAVAEVDVSTAEQLADQLRSGGILAPGGVLEFAHPLIRAAVYADLAPGARSAAHRRAAELLRADDASDDQVAAHLLLSEPAGSPEAVDALRRAAKVALARASPETAASFLERALDEPPSGETRADVLRELAFAHWRAGSADAVATLRTAIEATGDPQRRQEDEILLALWLFARTAGAKEALDLLDHHAERLRDSDPPRALDLAARALAIAQQMGEDGLAERVQRFRDDCRKHAPQATAACVLADRLAMSNERVAEVNEAAVAAVERSLESSRRPPALWEYAPLALVATEDYAVAVRLLESAMRVGRERGSIPMVATALTVRAVIQHKRGELLDAEADARLALGEIGWAERTFRVMALGALIRALVDRGEWEQARALLSEHRFNGAAPRRGVFAYPLGGRGHLRLAEGRPDEALEDFLTAGDLLDRNFTTNASWTPWRQDAALALNALGRNEEAVCYAAEQLELAQALGTPRSIGCALRVSALVGTPRDRIDRLERAVAALSRADARLDHARALIDLGAALRRGNRRSDAREPLRQGLDIAQRRSATPLAQRAAEELAATGARPRRLMLRGVESLTASERRVAQMAAEGYGNREIAQALFVTRKTVEKHLGNAYMKLDIHSREKLADRLNHGEEAPLRGT